MPVFPSPHETPRETSRGDQRRRVARLARFATVLLLLFLFVGTHYPPHAIPRQIAAADKYAHCLAYLSLAISALTSWELTVGMLLPQHYFTVWLLGTLYGAFDEVTQIPVGRHCDGLDWFSDILGIVLGLILYRLVRPLLHRLMNLRVAVH